MNTACFSHTDFSHLAPFFLEKLTSSPPQSTKKKRLLSSILPERPVETLAEGDFHVNLCCCVSPATFFLAIDIEIFRPSAQRPQKRDSWPEMTSAVYGNLPVSNPPPGSISNFDHPQTLAIDIFVGVGVCLGLAFAFVLLRLYVRLAVTRTWGWDDCELLHTVIVFEAHDK